MALGVIIAILSTKKSFATLNVNFFSSPVKTALFLILMCFSLAIFTKPEPVIFFQVGITALTSGCLVLVASFNKNYFARNAYLITICDYIGSRSYSLYLTHVIALSVTRGLFMNGNPDYSDTGTMIRLTFFFVLTIIFTELSYRYIENKYRYHWKRKK